MTRRKKTRFEQPAPFVQVVRWKLKDGTVRVGYRARVMHMGKRVKAQVHDTSREAEDDAKEIIDKGECVPSDVLTFARAVAQTRDAMVARGVKWGTLAWFDSHRKQAESFFGATFLHRIGHLQLDEFFTWRRRNSKNGVTNNGLQHDRRFLLLVFRLAHKRRALRLDPTAGYDWPKAVATRHDFFMPEEFAALLRKIRRAGGDDDSDIVAILANSGIRLSELGRLRVASVNLADRMLTIDGKRGPRLTEIRPQLVPHFRRLLAGRDSFAHRRTEFVLPPFTNEGIEPTKKKPVEAVAHERRTEVVTRALERWARKLDERKLHPHAMRHTCGVAMALAGKSEYQIMGLLGVTAAMAKHYANLVTAMRGKGLEGIKLAT